MQNIVNNTDKLAKLLSESNKSKQTNSSKKTLTRIFTFFMSHEKVRDQSPTEWGFAFPRGYSSSPPITCSAGSSAT